MKNITTIKQLNDTEFKKELRAAATTLVTATARRWKTKLDDIRLLASAPMNIDNPTRKQKAAITFAAKSSWKVRHQAWLDMMSAKRRYEKLVVIAGARGMVK